MKKCCIVLCLLLCLTGCGTQQTMETVADEYVQSVSSAVQQVVLELPEEAASPVMESEDAGKLFLCRDYTVILQTVDAGDLDKTLLDATGYAREDLKLVETVRGTAKRYDCVWTAAGEGEEQVCRLCILDDGNYHYVLTVMADASKAGQLQETWNGIFDSFSLLDPGQADHTGS